VKPPRFDLSVPTTLEQALSELSAGDGDARALAGGQSLIPLLNFRLGAPGVLVDLGRIPELVGVSIDGSAIAVAAMTPTSRLLRPDVAAASPLLAAAAHQVGHPQIRSRGTVGGSIAHADPAAELPALAVLTDAVVEVSGPRGRRDVAAGDFFEGLFTTACEWDELVTAVRFPRLAPAVGWGFREFARRPGDFALAGIGATVASAGDTIEEIAVVAFGLGAAPVRARAAEQALRGRVPTPELVAEARRALESELDPADTLHGSGAYRRTVAGVLLERTLGDALRAPEAVPA
jgi:carbon-monoxide dehydrogenase medium subunit